jgi:hypothetical protein
MPRKPDSRDLRYLQFVTDRTHGHSDKEIADKLVSGTPSDLYSCLADDGYPVCPVCGAAPVDKARHCELPKQRKPGAGAGQHRELPPPALAVGLFQERLEALQVLLRDAEDLEHRQEGYQDGRFPGADVYECTLVFTRYGRDNDGCRLEIYSEEQWRKLCEQYGQDPEEEHFGVMNSVLQAPTEAAPVPSEPLTTLIGVYALAGGQIEPLLEALYPGEPSREVLEEVRKCVEGKKKPDKKDGLKAVARQLAILARGGGLKGAPPIALSSEEHDAACYITQLREENRSEELIRRSLSNHRKPDGSKLTKEDVDRLGRLRLRYPKA